MGEKKKPIKKPTTEKLTQQEELSEREILELMGTNKQILHKKHGAWTQR